MRCNAPGHEPLGHCALSCCVLNVVSGLWTGLRLSYLPVLAGRAQPLWGFVARLGPVVGLWDTCQSCHHPVQGLLFVLSASWAVRYREVTCST